MADPNYVQSDIRKHTNNLLGRNKRNRREPIDVNKLPAAWEVEAYHFDEAGTDAVTVDNFRPNFADKPLSDWNKSAIRVFTNDFHKNNKRWTVKRSQIRESYIVYFKTLSQRYRDQIKSDVMRKVQDRRDHRKRLVCIHLICTTPSPDSSYQLFHRRLMSAEAHAPEHREILEIMGVDGMSTDESDSESGGKFFAVLQKPWRSQALQIFLRTFDGLSPHDNNQGSLCHARHDSQRSCERRSAVKQLPINAYDAKWYAQQSEHRQRQLAAKVEYDFVLPDEVVA